MNTCTSYLNILDTQTGAVTRLKSFDHLIEAPNWISSSNSLLYNSGGRLYRFMLDSGTEAMVDTDFCTGCNNDHVLSPDETQVAVSHGGLVDGIYTSRIYRISLSGGAPVQITPNSPSFLHGWSPDGKELCYCAFRKIETQLSADIYTIPADGGEERRLTSGSFNDGPEYSPDGKTIWFNSTRSGLMQIWHMARDGTDQRQMTFNDRNNWFPHVSPDGKQVVYLSYSKEDLQPDQHLPDLWVELWLMNSDGSEQRPVLKLFGGQGTINVNSWSRDSRRLAFVSYEPRSDFRREGES